MLKPEEREVEQGRVLVQQVFKSAAWARLPVAACFRGSIERNCRVRVIRDSTIIGDYAIDTLRREKDDAKEVREGMSAASSWPDSTTSRKATCSTRTRLKKWRGRCEVSGVRVAIQVLATDSKLLTSFRHHLTKITQSG